MLSRPRALPDVRCGAPRSGVRSMVMLKSECRTFVVLVTALAVDCGGDTRTSSPDQMVDARSSGGGAHDGGSHDIARGGSNGGGAGRNAGGAGTGGNVPDADRSV